MFILLFNNGQSYEDYSEWIAGIFKSYKKALEYGKKNATGGNDFEIQKWSYLKDKYDKYWNYDINGKLEDSSKGGLK